MKVQFTRQFEKLIDALRDTRLKNEISQAVNHVMQAKTSTDISNLKKLKGHKTAYRIRTGNYRIGVFIEKDTVLFAAFAHRKEIYKHFP